jgi:hypothetical protein
VSVVLSPEPIEHPALHLRETVAPARIAPLTIHVYDIDRPCRCGSYLARLRGVAGRSEAIAVASQTGLPGGGRVAIEGLPPGTNGSSGQVTVRHEGATEIAIDVDAQRSTALVLRDAYDPGWSALVNGTQAPLLRADGRQRAVPVPRWPLPGAPPLQSAWPRGRPPRLGAVGGRAPRPLPAAAPPREPPFVSFLLCFVMFLSGGAALLFETLWFRQAGLMLGNSVWSTSIVTAAFMGGLALGNAAVARWGAALRRPLASYALIEATIGGTGLGLVLLFPALTRALLPSSAGGSSGPTC